MEYFIHYVFTYMVILGAAFVYQGYRLYTCVVYVNEQQFSDKWQVLQNIVNHEMFWWNRLTVLITIMTFPLFILWHIIFLLVLIICLIASVIATLFLFISPLIYTLVCGVLSLVKPWFTLSFWLEKR